MIPGQLQQDMIKALSGRLGGVVCDFNDCVQNLVEYKEELSQIVGGHVNIQKFIVQLQTEVLMLALCCFEVSLAGTRVL